jgi:PST family polysaccharide transporter
MKRRLLGFLLVPAIAALSPIIALPAVTQIAGPGGWASAIAGESIGTFAAIAIGWGWATVGPALISIAGNDDERARLYRESLIVRLSISILALPALAVICWLIATPGAEWLTILMGMQGALIALSFTWFSAGVGDPRTIVIFDAAPRLLANLAAAALVLATGVVVLYPLAGILVTLVGTSIFTMRLLRRHPGPWPRPRDLPRLLRSNLAVALNDAGLSGYSSVPAPVVNVTAMPTAASGYATADKMLKLGQFIPMTLANALQAWIGEAHGPHRARRMTVAIGLATATGLLGWAGLALVGPWLTSVYLPAAPAPFDILLVMGLVFFFFSVRTAVARLVLFPAGQAAAVMRATLIATVLGIPLMIGLGIAWGPVGAALGYAFTEGAAALLLTRRCLRVLRDLRHETVEVAP